MFHRLYIILEDWWHWNGFSLCYNCHKPFMKHAFWNPDGPYGNGRLCCSMECCAKERGVSVEEFEGELP